jgi:hypothetical protein
VEAIAATADDYRVAYELAREVLASTLVDLKKPARELLEAMKELASSKARRERLPRERVTLTRRELREHTGLPDTRVWRLLKQLVQLEHVELASGSNGRVCRYRLGAAGPSSPEEVVAGLVAPERL